MNGEEAGLAGVASEPPVPSRFGCWEEDFPRFSVMLVSRDEPVDPESQLAAVRNSTTDWDLGSRAERTAEDSEGNFALLEGAKESTVGKLVVDVGGDILGGDRSRREIPLCIFWIRQGDEGEIPTKLQGFTDFNRIKITLQGEAPNLDGEGRTRKWNAEAIHVGPSTGDVVKSLSSGEEFLDDVGARSDWKGVKRNLCWHRSSPHNSGTPSLRRSGDRVEATAYVLGLHIFRWHASHVAFELLSRFR